MGRSGSSARESRLKENAKLKAGLYVSAVERGSKNNSNGKSLPEKEESKPRN